MDRFVAIHFGITQRHDQAVSFVLHPHTRRAEAAPGGSAVKSEVE
jgi:hypothetical protein